jgi:2-oxoisovalerate dehydrogenase E1 component
MLRPLPGFERDTHGRPSIPLDDASCYAYGHLIRRTEQRILDLFGRGLVSGTTHTCLGQELCQMSVVRALDHEDDVVLSNHRNHGHFMSYSGGFAGLIGEVLGREAGVNGGYGGSQHMAWRGFHSNGVQAGMTALGVGMALHRKQAGSKAIVATMIGDGTLGEGLLYEAMNLAAIWGLKVLIVVEHNGIAQTTPTSQTIGGNNIEARGAAFGLRTWRFDDAEPDFLQSVAGVVEAIREGNGPGLLVIDTCRLGPHSKGDDLRPEEDKARIAARDPLMALARKLPADTVQAIEARNEAFLDAVEKDVLASPAATFKSVPTHGLRPQLDAEAPVPAQEAASRNLRQSINDALRALLTHDPRVVLLGEDLHEPYGGAFKVTAGLSEDFAGRVISTPISEAGISGAGIGLAMEGARPIVEIMFADFVTLTFDQLYNHAVKFAGMFEGVSVPLVLRTPAGGRRGYGPTHSQNPENLLVSIPGLTVVFPSHRHNAGQILVDLVERWPNPAVYLEHKLLYGQAQDPGNYQVISAAPGDHAAALFPTLRSGSDAPDVTVLSFGGMLPVVEAAVEKLRSEEELEIEIISPALLAPLPRGTLLNALLHRPRLLIVEESQHEFGVSAEIVALLAEAGYTGQVQRMGAAPVPIASARSLERDQIPDENAVIAAVLELV